MRRTAKNPAAPAKTPTLADIATELGVTKITVSRALNTPDRVSPQTLEKVRAAVQRLGYTPNLLAGSLSSSRSRLIVALVPSISGPMFTTTMQSVARHLRERGYQLLIGQAGYDEASEAELLAAIIGRRPDGIILTGIAHSPEVRRQLQAAHIPVVETWDLTPQPIDMLVGFSHPAIGAAAAAHLFARGCRRPAILSPDDRRARQRASAFIARYRELAGDAVLPVPVQEAVAPTPMGAGRAGLAALLAAQPGIDGLFCGSDNLALGALIEARQRGLAVPGQLAVIGYGDQEFGADSDPPLTSLRIDGGEIGRLAAAMLVARAEGQAAFPVPAQAQARERGNIIDVGFTLVRRASA